jgi:hypothetical protein
MLVPCRRKAQHIKVKVASTNLHDLSRKKTYRRLIRYAHQSEESVLGEMTLDLQGWWNSGKLSGSYYTPLLAMPSVVMCFAMSSTR